MAQGPARISSGSSAWVDITGKPSTFPPSAHTHPATDVTEDTTHRFTTDTEKSTWNAKVSFPGFGTTAGTAAEGNDARLSDARTPLAHNQAWGTITSTPTTISGYGITDAQGLDSDLTALAGLSSTGLIARTADGAAATRTITGTANQVIVTKGDGAAGNPTLSLPQSIATTSTPLFAGVGVNGAASSFRLLQFYTGGVRRINVGTDGAGESGANAGANFQVNRFDDAGNSLGPTLFIQRSTGNVGINNTSPLRKLDVVGDAGGNGIRVTGTAGTIGAFTAEGTSVNIQADSAAATRVLVDAGSLNASGFVSLNGGSSGYVQLGTGGTARMQVFANGNVKLNSYGAGTLVTDSSGNVTASSDASLKTVTGSFTRGLNDVLNLTPRTYRWNERSGMNTEDENVGFIAQEVLEAIPEAVGQYRTSEVEVDGKKTNKREKAELLTLSDRPIIAALVNAVKELKAENDDLRARVSALEKGKASK